MKKDGDVGQEIAKVNQSKSHVINERPLCLWRKRVVVPLMQHTIFFSTQANESWNS